MGHRKKQIRHEYQAFEIVVLAAHSFFLSSPFSSFLEDLCFLRVHGNGFAFGTVTIGAVPEAAARLGEGFIARTADRVGCEGRCAVVF